MFEWYNLQRFQSFEEKLWRNHTWKSFLANTFHTLSAKGDKNQTNKIKFKTWKRKKKNTVEMLIIVITTIIIIIIIITIIIIIIITNNNNIFIIVLITMLIIKILLTIISLKKTIPSKHSGFIQKMQPFLRTFQGPPTRNIISQIVQIQ